MAAARRHSAFATMKKCGMMLSMTLILLFCGKASYAAQEVGEYHIKAVFLLNLAHFVNWPNEDKVSDESFVIGIYGPDPFGPILDQAIVGESKHTHPITVRRYSRLSELAGEPCRILFIHSSKLPEWKQISRYITDTPVLTVADSVGFPQQGGMVNLLKSGQTIQIQINHDAVLESGLSMSAKLLNLAHIVDRHE